MNDIKLTQYSHGAGCGCKIAPDVLETILSNPLPEQVFPGLIVGNHSKDDAAVFDLGNGEAIISTTDFFMPIVDNPEDFGGIASVNAISDIYAMGGSPLMAIAILGWPLDKIPAEVASRVLAGSRNACDAAGIPLAGGHSIDAPEPIFGLAVTGRIKTDKLKRNSSARPDSLLYLTKPLGVGIVTTAQKKGIVRQEHLDEVRKSMLTLNTAGEKIAELEYVSAMTDVTGFGLLGHLIELCQAANLTADISFSKVPVFDFIEDYVKQGSFPGGTGRNLRSYGHHIESDNNTLLHILADPQTSGGLLVAVDSESAPEFEREMSGAGLKLNPFGTLSQRRDQLIRVND
jgi:selenide,water dikinase